MSSLESHQAVSVTRDGYTAKPRTLKLLSVSETERAEMLQYLSRNILDLENLIDHHRRTGIDQGETRGELKAYRNIRARIEAKFNFDSPHRQ